MSNIKDEAKHDINANDVDQVLRKYDKGSDFRNLTGIAGKVITALLICFSVFQIMTAVAIISLDAMMLRSTHIAFGLSLIFLFYPASKKWSREKIHPVDLCLAIITAAACMYLVVNYKQIVLRMGVITTTDMIVGIVVVLLVMEAARRVIGWPMVIISVIFLLYAFFGRYVPGPMAHRGVDLNNLIGHLFYTTEGILGLPIGVSSTFIFMFLLFGAYLEKTGMGEFFIDLANSIAGSAAGGPAKVAVLSSACMGTLSGSSVANVVGTGSFTIPMMKKLGYKPEFAGAVEATASTGGQLMPPIMGAAAFLMAESIGVPYIEVIGAACIPALLYYFGVWAGVHYEARKLDLKGLPKEQLPKFLQVMKKRGLLIIPIIAVVYLLTAGYSPVYAAMGAILTAIVCSYLTSFINKEKYLSVWDLLDGLAKGAKSALTVIAACACAGIIIGVVTKTGLGLKMGSLLVSFANGNLMMTLVFAMVTSLILGIGVPTTANYVITSTIAAPALVTLGVPVIAAHMFVFYFGIIADVTPPVCLAAVAASGVAKSEPMKTGLQATRLAIAAFIIPYIFVLSPSLLLVDATIIDIVINVITALLGIIAISASLTGYFKTKMSILERVLFVIGGLLMIMTSMETNIVGVVLMVIVYVLQKRKVTSTIKVA